MQKSLNELTSGCTRRKGSLGQLNKQRVPRADLRAAQQQRNALSARAEEKSVARRPVSARPGCPASARALGQDSRLSVEDEERGGSFRIPKIITRQVNK